MGLLKFTLPPGLPPEILRELERAYVSSGPDYMPHPTDIHLDPALLHASRAAEESGFLSTPWGIPGAGLLLTGTATLMERPEPYQLQVELARGKVNQLRGMAADWQMGGLQIPVTLAQEIKDATQAFGRAVTRAPSPASEHEAQNALVLACHAAEQLAGCYATQVFQARHQRQPRFDTTLGCRLGPAVPDDRLTEVLKDAFNTIVIPFAWNEVERSEGDYHWEAYEAVLAWAEQEGFHVSAGPLVDFTPARLPSWLWLWERDRSSLASFICDYVEVVVKRYQGRIRSWQLSAGANLSTVFSLSEEELLWLTVQMAETVRRIDPSLAVSIGIAQPWGDYLAEQERVHSPFVFADTLLRNGVQLAALDLELLMGVVPRGSYCRDLLEVSRILDLYALLGVPLQVTLAYPAEAGKDALAVEPEQAVDAGFWRTGISPTCQADWADAFAGLALAKPYSRAVHWAHLSDAVPHQLPHCGLVDAAGKPRPALERLGALRRKHLR
jgi:hypothetical protein